MRRSWTWRRPRGRFCSHDGDSNSGGGRVVYLVSVPMILAGFRRGFMSFCVWYPSWTRATSDGRC
jgi:hypothetical protein